MKTYIGILIVFFVIPFFSFSTVRAEDNETDVIADSLSISNEIKEQLNLKGDEKQVFRAYSPILVVHFTTYDSIGDILNDKDVSSYIIVESSSGKLTMYREDDIHSQRYNKNARISEVALDELKTHNSLNKISKDITVKRVYFLYCNPYYGNAIYYETDKGDYVYYTDTGYGELLFTADDFFEMQKEIRANLTGKEGINTIPQNWDKEKISKYDINSENFNLGKDALISSLYLYIAAGVVVAAGITTAVLVIKRKRNK